MNKVPLEIVIPVYNEGENLIKLLHLLNFYVKTKFKVLICYDNDDDDCFEFQDQIKKFNFESFFVKNKGIGPCSAVKEGLYYGNSDCVIVYPADDILNCDILDLMYEKFTQGNDVVVASRFIKGGSMKGCPFILNVSTSPL